MQPAAPARQHLKFLSERGVSPRQVASLSGLSGHTLRLIANGTTQRLRPATVSKPMAVKYRPAQGVKIDATGTRRRLQGLMFMGWTHTLIADRLGVAPSNLWALFASQPQVTAGTAAAVKALYQEWGMIPGPSKRAATIARRKGYVSPLAWDDPDTDRQPRGVAA